MKTLFRNLLLALPMIAFMGCEDLELDISKDQNVEFEFVASSVEADGTYSTTQTINFGADEFEDFDINSATINQLSYTISDVDNATGFSTYFWVDRAGQANTGITGTASPIRNVSEPIVFWNQENGFISNEFFFDEGQIDAIIEELQAAIANKSSYGLFLGAEASGELEDITITLNIDVTANTVQ